MEIWDWLIIACAIVAIVTSTYIVIRVLWLIISALEKYIKEK